MKTTEYIVATDAEFDWALLQRNIKQHDTPEAAEKFMRELVASLHVVEVVTERKWAVSGVGTISGVGWEIMHDVRPDGIHVPDDAKITEHVHTARRFVSSMAWEATQQEPAPDPGHSDRELRYSAMWRLLEDTADDYTVPAVLQHVKEGMSVAAAVEKAIVTEVERMKASIAKEQPE